MGCHRSGSCSNGGSLDACSRSFCCLIIPDSSKHEVPNKNKGMLVGCCQRKGLALSVSFVCIQQPDIVPKLVTVDTRQLK